MDDWIVPPSDAIESVKTVLFGLVKMKFSPSRSLIAASNPGSANGANVLPIFRSSTNEIRLQNCCVKNRCKHC